MKIRAYIFLTALFVAALNGCEEGRRFEPGSDDTTPPGAPTILSWEPLHGGARFVYEIPGDEDLMTVDAEYTNPKGKTFRFTSSFYKDTIEVKGFGSTDPQVVRLYGVDRAGNKSKPVEQVVVPLEPAVLRVAESLVLKPGFSSFFVDWINEQEQIMNVYVHYKFEDNGVRRDLTTVFSSNRPTDRKFVENLNLPSNVPIEVALRVEDRYENSTEEISFGSINLLEDTKLDKSLWVIPVANDSTVVSRNGTRVNTGVPAMFGDNREGRMANLIDDVIDAGDNLNIFHTGGRGRTGSSAVANPNDWNIIIDLGGYYQLSRIITHQRWRSDGVERSRGQYYRNENCGEYRLYVFNEETLAWDPITEHRIPIPQGITELQIFTMGQAGDMAYFYPDDPQYTPPTRWFRYEMLNGFEDNYSTSHSNINCMSELTLYGKRAE